jgi:hypothetical protein
MPALDKLTRLQQREDEKSASYAAIFQHQDAVRDRLRKAQRHFHDLKSRHPADPVFAGRDNTGMSRYRAPLTVEEREKQIIAVREKILGDAKDEVDRARAEMERLQQQTDEIRARASPVPSRIVTWARSQPAGTRLKLYDRRIKVPAGDPQKIVAELREKLKAVELQRQQIATAPFPAHVAAARVRRWVDGLAQRGEIDLLRVIELDIDPGIPTLRKTLLSGEVIDMPDAAAMLAWLHRDLLVDRCLQLVNELAADDREAYTAEQRLALDADLAREFLELERQEEAVIEAGESVGTSIPRRDGASPIAVLGLQELASDRRQS